MLVIAAALVGILARIICVWLAPQSAYLPDHISYMGWAEHAVQNGPHTLYDLPAGQVLLARQPQGPARTAVLPVRNPHAFNYPPGSALILWGVGQLWHALDGNVAEFRVPQSPDGRQPAFAVRGRVIDTTASRAANAAPGILFDALLAWGVAALAAALRPATRWPPAIAAALTLLAPPVFLNSCYWTQADGWLAAALVWCLVHLMHRRLLWAGVLMGVAVLIKPQAVLMAPVLALALLVQWKTARALVAAAASAALLIGGSATVVLAVSLPTMFHDASSAENPHGATRWVQRSYVGTISDPRYNRITLNALNIWYLELLRQTAGLVDAEAPRSEIAAARRTAWDNQRRVGPLTRQQLGLAMLAAGVLLAAVASLRGSGWHPRTIAVFAFLTFLAAFTLPTKVHERYIYFCLPPLLALAAAQRRWTPPLIALLVVATAEMVSFQWMDELSPAPRAWAALLSCATIAAFLYSVVAACWPTLPAATHRAATGPQDRAP